jgi:hypothetical protein
VGTKGETEEKKTLTIETYNETNEGGRHKRMKRKKAEEK